MVNTGINNMRKKASFLNNPKPLLCVMVQEATPDGAIEVISNALYEGAEAFGIQLECLDRAFRSEEDLKKIFSACKGLPIYVTSYRNYYNTGMTDEECMEFLLFAGKCGATLLDVMGDTFDPCYDELTFDDEAINKQKELIRKIHDLGCEVLISTHFKEYRDRETVMKFAKAQQERGTDVVKIINISNNEKELLEHINICADLKREIDCEYLYMASGEDCRLLRQICGRLGTLMYLSVNEYRGIYSKEQTILRSQKLIRDNMVK